MVKMIYDLLNKGIDKTLETTGGCKIEDISITGENEITIYNESGEIYTIKIKEDK